VSGGLAIRAGPGRSWWQVAVLLGAIAASAAAVSVTLSADFLTYPGWLALQKADFILGPVLTGLYWQRRRPRSRFGPMLIGFGFLGALYVLQSSGDSWLFSAGLLAETVLGLATRVLILAFPTGRLDRPACVVLVISILVSSLPAVLSQLVSPQTGAGASISGCREACPPNALAIADDPELAADLLEVFRFYVILASSLTAALLVHRLVRGTPPQRRALAIGTPVALLFLGFQITFQLLGALHAPPSDFSEVVRWGIVAARAALWYGFLAALIAAQLFAARAMTTLLRRSAQGPSRDELEAMLREPLGDPHLRLAFLDGRTGPPVPEPGRAVTLVRREGGPDVAIVHDPQLDDDPELLEAAGALALLAARNARLHADQLDALQQLQHSRARLVRAADEERRKVERDLHDSIQQELISIKLRLELCAEDERPSPARLLKLAGDLGGTLEEVRKIGHGLYPPLLTASGLPAALRHVAEHAAPRVGVAAVDVARYPPDIESAVYYCCTEAIQNATKHGGKGVHVTVRLAEEGGRLAFSVVDDGPGFRPGEVRGVGLQNMEDRLGALGGRLQIRTAPGRGTAVSGEVPLREAVPVPERALHLAPW